MKPSFRYLQSTGNEATTPPGLVSEQSAIVQTSEINRLLTAAVVNRRFCRLLLTNPLAALAQGYRGEAFRLNPEEVHRLSKIHATSLRDFALQLLSQTEAETVEAKTGESYPHLTLAAFSSNGV